MNKSWLSDKDYNFIYSSVPRLCVDLIIKDKRGLLLSYRTIEPAKNTWHIPGGRVLFRESLEKAAKRIALKELGVKIKVIKQLGVMEFLKEVQYGSLRHSLSIALLIKPLGEIKNPDFQSSKLDFFKTLPKNVYKEHLKFLKSL